MAVVTVKSGPITNRDTVPIVMTKAALMGGNVKAARGTVEVTNGDSIASKFIFFEVPSNAIPLRLLIGCDAITSAAADIGLYRTTKDGGAVVDADAFASAQSIASAIVVNTDVIHESAVFGVEDVEKELWEVLGLTADPNVMYDLVATLTAAATATGTLSLTLLYTTNQ